MSEAVTVWEPVVLRVTLAVRVPADNAALAGSVALESLEVIPTVWVLLTRFQFASTDRTVTLKAIPALWAVGVPVLPVAEPGAAVSPGTSTCNFTNAPALTVSSWVALVRPLAAAVIVGVPAFGSLYLKLALLEPLATDTLEMVEVSVASRKAYVPVESLLRLTVMVASEVFGLLKASWRWTVMFPEVTVAVSVWVEVVKTSLLAEAGVTVNWPLTKLKE